MNKKTVKKKKKYKAWGTLLSMVFFTLLILTFLSPKEMSRVGWPMVAVGFLGFVFMFLGQLPGDSGYEDGSGTDGLGEFIAWMESNERKRK